MSDAIAKLLAVSVGLSTARFLELFAATLGLAIAAWLHRSGYKHDAAVMAAASVLTAVGVLAVSVATGIATMSEPDGTGGNIWLFVYFFGPACHIPAQAMFIWVALSRRPHEQSGAGTGTSTGTGLGTG